MNCNLKSNAATTTTPPPKMTKKTNSQTLELTLIPALEHSSPCHLVVLNRHLNLASQNNHKEVKTRKMWETYTTLSALPLQMKMMTIMITIPPAKYHHHHQTPTPSQFFPKQSSTPTPASSPPSTWTPAAPASCPPPTTTRSPSLISAA